MGTPVEIFISKNRHFIKRKQENILFMLMSVEIMFNAAGLAFVLAGAHNGQADGQVMLIFILAMAAAEVAVHDALAHPCFAGD